MSIMSITLITGEQEDGVVTSGLPLSVLWLRVEQLRAAAHFLPDPNCDSDPQRVVFSDDMAGICFCVDFLRLDNYCLFIQLYFCI